MVELKPGARFQSTVCSTEVIVVKGAGEVDLTCGGAPMVASGTGEISGTPSDDAAGGTHLCSDATCAKPGATASCRQCHRAWYCTSAKV